MGSLATLKLIRRDMAYQVIARKWRPKTFDELIGQSHVAQTLKNALKNDRLPHALLFTGSRGVGKTSAARILAKGLKCPNATNFIPCNECEVCSDISAGSQMDVMEIDGASNNGVEAVRELIEKVGYMPSIGKFKIYIIDEVHMLSTSAFNALLKTLEEPPEHVKFVFATTEVQKIPNTILSRCQRFDFRRIPTRQICDHLTQICKSEDVSASHEALWSIARQADGSMRDSQSLLDQVITFSDGEITIEKVIDVLGLTDRALVLDTLSGLVKRSPHDILGIIERIYMSGYDPKVFTNDLIEEIRHLLFIKECNEEAQKFVDLPDSEIESLKELSTHLSKEDIHLLFDMALKGGQDIPRADDPRIVLEMILLRMANAPRIENFFELKSSASTPAQPTSTQKKKLQLQSIDKRVTAKEKPQPTKKEITPKEKKLSRAFNSDSWHEFVLDLAKTSPVLAAKIENLSLLKKDDLKIYLGIKKQKEFILNQLQDPTKTQELKEHATEFFGLNLEFQFEVMNESKAPLSPSERAEKDEEARQASIKNEIESHPFILKAKQLFKTEIRSIKEYKS